MHGKKCTTQKLNDSYLLLVCLIVTKRLYLKFVSIQPLPFYSGFIESKNGKTVSLQITRY